MRFEVGVMQPRSALGGDYKKRSSANRVGGRGKQVLVMKLNGARERVYRRGAQIVHAAGGRDAARSKQAARGLAVLVVEHFSPRVDPAPA